MNELINTHDSRTTIRWKLLTGVSALALAACVSSVEAAKAEDGGHPLIWIELGGQAEQLQGASTPFTAPFMFTDPLPKVYAGKPFIDGQRLPSFTFGGEGKLTFQPEHSNWVFSVSARYGRTNNQRQLHHQTFTKVPPKLQHSGLVYAYDGNYTDTKTRNGESHLFLDFQAGKDVGMGMFGRDSTSVVSLGVRFARLDATAKAGIRARPLVTFHNTPAYHKYWTDYILNGNVERSFHGVGPSLSWNGSVPIAGHSDDSEIALDFGITGAVLFGRQKAQGSHYASAYKFGQKYNNKIHTAHGIHATKLYKTLYYHRGNPIARSRSVTAPDLGGFAGVSFRYRDAKVSFGYRAEILMNAFDRGIDKRDSSNITFNGPYASISIGLGD